MRGQDKSRAFGRDFHSTKREGSIVFPGSVGGVNWGGAAYDPQRHLLVMDTNRLAIFVRLIPREKYDADVKVATSNDRLHGECGRQTGAPYAMFRRL